MTGKAGLPIPLKHIQFSLNVLASLLSDVGRHFAGDDVAGFRTLSVSGSICRRNRSNRSSGC
jgi:hypothetical protein